MSAQPTITPRQPRRMKQPRKDLLRDQLALAATTMTEQRAEIEHLEAALGSLRGAYARLWAERNGRRWWRWWGKA